MEYGPQSNSPWDMQGPCSMKGQRENSLKKPLSLQPARMWQISALCSEGLFDMLGEKNSKNTIL